MNLFAPDLGDSAEEIASAARPSPCERLIPAASNCCFFFQMLSVDKYFVFQVTLVEQDEPKNASVL
jgi:hypothetical protein